MQALQTTNVRQEIQKMKALPPLPVIAQQLLSVMNDEGASINDISEVIKRDPSLMSRLLGLANSAFFGFGRKVFTLEDAMIYVLGLDMVKAIALSMVMGGAFDVKKCEHFQVNKYWASSLMTAELSKQVAGMMNTVDDHQQNLIFLSGLLHNLGILILTDKFPKLMDEIFKIASKDPDRRLIYTQQAMLDMDHHQAGAWLAHKWHLPEEVINVIEHHHEPANTDHDNVDEVLIVGYCSRTVRNWIMGKDFLLPKGEDSTLDKLGLDKTNMIRIAKKCHARMEEFQGIANEMAT